MCSDPNCSSCPTDRDFCTICTTGYCISNIGTCMDCLNAIQGETKVYFSINPTNLHKNGEYYISFSEVKWIMAISNSGISTIVENFSIEIQGYEESVDYQYILTFNQEKLRVEANITYLTTIEPTLIIARVSKKNLIKSPSGGLLAHLETSTNFPGYSINDDSISYKTAEAVSKFTQIFTQPASYLGIVAVSTGPICGLSFKFLAKMIQIIEFSGLMEYYNIHFDSQLAELLSSINESTEFTLLNIPIDDKVNTKYNSKAATWRGKLTALGYPSYILQDFGYPAIVMLIIYFTEFAFVLLGKSSPVLMKFIRISIF